MRPAIITTMVGYVCNVGIGTALDQAFHGQVVGKYIIFYLFTCLFTSSILQPNNIRVIKKIIEIVLGLETEPNKGPTHYSGLLYLLVTPGSL